MSARRRKAEAFVRHLALGLSVNLTTVPLLAGIWFFQTPMQKLAAGLGVLSCFEVWAFVLGRMKRTWQEVRPLVYYFLPTAVIFWMLSRRRHVSKAESSPEIARLRMIVATWPDPSIRFITGILDPKRRQRTLTRMINEMDGMRDARLATLTDRIRQYLGVILEAVSENENYALFGQIMSRLSSYGPDQRRQTYKSFLRLLTDVFEPALSGHPHRSFQRDMTGPLKRTIEQSGRAQAATIQQIVAGIMADGLNEHEIAGSVADVLLQLDWIRQRWICRILFDESLKRAFLFPRQFGARFLNTLGKLEHRVLWLEMPPLQAIVQESLGQIEAGLINSNPSLYNELCSKVFAPVEEPACHGVGHARVFRRLTDDGGRVKIDCICAGGRPCSCEGQSLSFRGVYSKSCHRDVGEKLAMTLVPIRDAERRFTVKASIAPLHPYESGTHGPGRGALFEDAEPSVAKDLYEYVSTKQ
jgi:hypothetical protein